MIKNCSFVEFLDKYEAVEIPILQRDYAQGRLDLQNKELNRKGENFIKVLFDHLCSNRRLSMDIIYGSIEIRNSAESNKETFIPLDGQQRLTTLWLLHWYLAQWEGKGAEYVPRLRKFTYATRSTAREFCKQLCDMELGHDELAKPSKYFSQKMWFTSQYGYDPTVQAMLNAIAKQYKEKNQTIPLERLEQLQFRSFDIGLYNLTDDLYIKMNGRGKQLSGIENLKADFVGYLKAQGHDFSNANSYDRKFDHEWADMAWGEKENDGFDIRYLRLFHRYFYNLWIIDSEQTADNVPEELNANFTGKEYAGFEPYKKILDKENGRLERMVAFFDFLANEDNLVYSKRLLNPWRDEQENKYPYLLDKKISMENRIALYAMMLYIDNSSEGINRNIDSYEKWMRIVWNLIIDPNSRNYGGQKRYMDLLSRLAPHAADIEDFLRTNDIKEISGNKRLELEKKKLEYLDRYPNRREALLKAEASRCLQGQVGFLLEIEETDDYFKRFVELTVENIKPEWSWCAEHLWPALIALLEKPLFEIREKWGENDYLSHNSYRLQDLLNRPHIAEALRKLFDQCIAQNKDFQTVCAELCTNYQYNEELYWHYPLVKGKILPLTEYGRIYYRGEQEGICLHKSWRVTENAWRGYWRLSEKEPILRTR